MEISLDRRPRFSRRAVVVASLTAALPVAKDYRDRPEPDSANLGVHRTRAYGAHIRQLRVSDRGGSLWIRTAQFELFPEQLRFRSADRHLPDGKVDAELGGWWAIDEQVLASVHAGAMADLSRDSSAPIQAALDAAAKLGRKVDDGNAHFLVDHSIRVPEGVEWKRVALRAGRIGMNVVLVSSRCKLLDFSIVGTGSRSPAGAREGTINERAIYPAHAGLEDVVLKGTISNITIGVHLQPLPGTKIAPRRCKVSVDVVDIVGTSGVSEGYGVLLSPAEDCQVDVRALRVQRHAVYLSSGASRNHIVADVTDCFQDAVTIYSLLDQEPCVGNNLRVTARGVRRPDGKPVASNSSCFSIYGKASENQVVVTALGASGDAQGPYAAAVVHGLSGPMGPFPTNNILTVYATGTFSGPYVIECVDASNTRIVGGNLNAHGKLGAIGFEDTRANSKKFASAGSIVKTRIRGTGQYGVVVATERSPVEIDEVEISGSMARLRDYTGMARSLR